jgi:hypothetical protein
VFPEHILVSPYRGGAQRRDGGFEELLAELGEGQRLGFDALRLRPLTRFCRRLPVSGSRGSSITPDQVTPLLPLSFLTLPCMLVPSIEMR